MYIYIYIYEPSCISCYTIPLCRGLSTGSSYSLIFFARSVQSKHGRVYLEETRLLFRFACLQSPNGARRIDTRCSQEIRIDFVPIERRQRSTEIRVLILETTNSNFPFRFPPIPSRYSKDIPISCPTLRLSKFSNSHQQLPTNQAGTLSTPKPHSQNFCLIRSPSSLSFMDLTESPPYTIRNPNDFRSRIGMLEAGLQSEFALFFV